MIAIVLLGFGSPEKLADVGPFVERVAGRALPPGRLDASVAKYALIGGVSPFCASARAQAMLLEKMLNDAGNNVKVYLGMRFWNPGVDEAVAAALANNPERIILMCLTPYFSQASAGEYLKTAEESLVTLGNTAPVARIDSWNEEAQLIAGFADSLIEASAVAPAGAPVLFTAHSLPQSMIDSGDPYAEQVRTTVEQTAEAAGTPEWRLGWQSEGHGQGVWLKPTAEDVLGELAGQGREAVVVMPIGFTADHMETLYDVDIVMKKQANDLGIVFARAECLNESEAVIAAMAAAVERKL